MVNLSFFAFSGHHRFDRYAIGLGRTVAASLAHRLIDQDGFRLVSDKSPLAFAAQFGRTISKFGWECVFVDVDDISAVQSALAQGGKRCKALWAESLANPGGYVIDLAPLAEAAHAHGVPFIVDNTMATPFLTRPFEHGADIVCHSTTKFLSGHGNAMGVR